MNQSKLKYHKKWFEYGFISETELTNQIKEYDKGEDAYSEHYRYKSFLDFIKKKRKFEDNEIIKFIELVELDIDQGMASSALVKLFLSKKLTPGQIENVSEKLKKYGDWAKKIVNKELSETNLRK